MDIIIPTSIFPSIEYIVCISLSNNAYIEKHETYPKQTLRNRYYIATAQGIQYLTIPVIKTLGNNTPVDKIEISSETDFRRNHFKTIQTNYKSAPYYDYYIDFIHDCLFFKEKSLIEYNTFVLKKICKILKINKEFQYTNEYLKEAGSSIDYRQKLCSKQVVGNFSYIKEVDNYNQVFKDKVGFIKNLSIIDLIFNEGPNTTNIINSQTIMSL